MMSSRRFPELVNLCVFAFALSVIATGCQQSPPPAGPPATQPGGEAAAETPSDQPAATPDQPAAEPVAFEVKVPQGLPALPVPEDNPMTAEKVELGKMLYFDKRMSKDGTVACATCHDPKLAWTEHKPTSEGIGG